MSYAAMEASSGMAGAGHLNLKFNSLFLVERLTEAGFRPRI